MAYVSFTGGADELPSLDKADIHGLAIAFKNLAGAILETDVARDGSTVSGRIGSQSDVWSGRAKEAYAREASLIKSAAHKAAGIEQFIHEKLENYNEAYSNTQNKIKKHQNDWDQAKSTYDNRMALVPKPGQAIDKNICYPKAEDVENELDSAQKRIAKAYNKDIRALDALAAATAVELKKRLEEFLPSSKTTGHNDADVRRNVGVAMFGDGGGFIATQTRVTDANRDADDAVKLLSDVDKNGNTRKESLDEFNSRYAKRLGTDPFLANAFAMKYGPGKIASFAANADRLDPDSAQRQAVGKALSAMGSGTMLATGSIPRDLDANSSDPHQRERVAMWNAWRSYGSTMEVKVEGENGKIIHKSLSEWQEGYLEQIKKIGRSSFDAKPFHNLGVYSSSTVKKESRGYVFLAQAWGLGACEHPELTFSREFVNGKHNVMHDLLKWNYEQKAHYNRDYLRDYKASGMHDTNDTNVSFASYGKPPLGTWDPVANVMHGLDGDPQMNRTFLSSNVGIEGNNDQNVTKYLVGGRYKLSGGEIQYPDKGEHLGKIVYEVTSMPDARRHKENFTVLREYIDGYKEAMDAGGFNRGQSRFGHNHSHLRRISGAILGPYMHDIAYQMQSSKADLLHYSEYPDRPGEYMLRVSAYDISRLKGLDGVLVDVSIDKQASKTMINHSMAQMHVDMVKNMRDCNYIGLKTTVASWTDTLETLTVAPHNANENMKKVLDQSNGYIQSLVSKGVSIVPFGDLVSIAGLSDWRKAGTVLNINAGKDWGLPKILETMLPTSNAETAHYKVVDAHNGVALTMKSQFLAAASEANTWPSGAETPQQRWGAKAGESDSPLNADGSLKPYVKMNSAAKSEYEDWMGSDQGLMSGQGKAFGEASKKIDDLLRTAEQSRKDATRDGH